MYLPATIFTDVIMNLIKLIETQFRKVCYRSRKYLDQYLFNSFMTEVPII